MPVSGLGKQLEASRSRKEELVTPFNLSVLSSGNHCPGPSGAKRQEGPTGQLFDPQNHGNHWVTQKFMASVGSFLSPKEKSGGYLCGGIVTFAP